MRRLAVLGHPVAHSRSPAMQAAALEALGLADQWSYEAIDIPPADFAELTRALPAEGFVGANVTIPHKEAALELADRASAAADEIGAANTLSFDDDEIRADNTDAPGLLTALGDPPAGKRALILGAGGSARAAVWALVSQGAAVEVWNRTPARADELVRGLLATRGELGATDPRLGTVTAEHARQGGFDLVVNCTSIGMPGTEGEDPFEALPIDPDGLGPEVTLLDLVYAGGETELVRAARERRAEAIDGIELLVRQGAESLRIWTGREPPLEAMREAARGG